jgi:hypothetical protein
MNTDNQDQTFWDWLAEWPGLARQARQARPYFTNLVRSTGLSQGKLAEVIGHDDRSIRRWMKGDRPYPYTVQYTLECLVLLP